MRKKWKLNSFYYLPEKKCIILHITAVDFPQDWILVCQLVWLVKPKVGKKTYLQTKTEIWWKIIKQIRFQIGMSSLGVFETCQRKMFDLGSDSSSVVFTIMSCCDSGMMSYCYLLTHDKGHFIQTTFQMLWFIPAILLFPPLLRIANLHISTGIFPALVFFFLSLTFFFFNETITCEINIGSIYYSMQDILILSYCHSLG